MTTIRCSTPLFKFGVVSSKIPRYLKVCTHLITSPLNTNSWHGSTKLNTMIFVFFAFIVSPRSTQNYWSASNYCCNPTFDFDVRARSFAKSNSHMCMFTKVGPLHSLPSKRPFRASKYNPNNKGLTGQPYFTHCYHLKLEVTPSLGWLMHMGYPCHTSPTGIARSVPPPRG